MWTTIISVFGKWFLKNLLKWLADYVKEKQAEDRIKKRVKDDIKHIKKDPSRANRAKRLDDMFNN